MSDPSPASPRFEDFEPLFSREELQSRVAEIGREIRRDLDRDSDLLVVGVLKGAYMFMADLIRHLPPHTACDFLRLSSYRGTQSTGRIRFEQDLTQPIRGRDVLIVEDIVDTGLTVSSLLEILRVRGPRSLRVCTLLHKPARTEREVPLSYVGFSVPDRFVIGYGLDFDERYRGLDYLAALKPEIEARLRES